MQKGNNQAHIKRKLFKDFDSLISVKADVVKAMLGKFYKTMRWSLRCKKID